MIERRGISLREAAAICGVSPGAYREWMVKGLVPGYWPGTRRIDRLALERALDRMSGLEQTDDPFENWLRQREAKRADQSAAHSCSEEAAR